MDFSSTPSVRIFRTYDNWEDLSAEAQALFLTVAQKMDSEGFPPDGYVIKAAEHLHCGLAVRELVDSGFLKITQLSFWCPWWKESQNAKKSNQLRQREWRERKNKDLFYKVHPILGFIYCSGLVKQLNGSRG